jgi:hypothetical protein
VWQKPDHPSVESSSEAFGSREFGLVCPRSACSRRTARRPPFGSFEPVPSASRCRRGSPATPNAIIASGAVISALIIGGVIIRPWPGAVD